MTVSKKRPPDSQENGNSVGPNRVPEPSPTGARGTTADVVVVVAASMVPALLLGAALLPAPKELCIVAVLVAFLAIVAALRSVHRKAATSIPGAVGGSTFFFALDALYFEYRFLGTLICFGVATSRGVMSLKSMRDGLLGSATSLACSALLYAFACLTAPLYLSYFNQLAAERGDRVLTALERFREDHGYYPETLDSLMPAYIDEIPDAKPTSAFNYRCHGDRDDPSTWCHLYWRHTRMFLTDGVRYFRLEGHDSSDP